MFNHKVTEPNPRIGTHVHIHVCLVLILFILKTMLLFISRIKCTRGENSGKPNIKTKELFPLDKSALKDSISRCPGAYLLTKSKRPVFLR